jgi:hypothetical protein
MGLLGKMGVVQGGGGGLVGRGSGHSLGDHRRVGSGMNVGPFQTNSLAAQSSFHERWEPAFKECCIPPNPIPQRELWVLDHPALSPSGKPQTLTEKFARKLGAQAGRPWPVTSLGDGVVQPVNAAASLEPFLTRIVANCL